MLLVQAHGVLEVTQRFGPQKRAVGAECGADDAGTGDLWLHHDRVRRLAAHRDRRQVRAVANHRGVGVGFRRHPRLAPGHGPTLEQGLAQCRRVGDLDRTEAAARVLDDHAALCVGGQLPQAIGAKSQGGFAHGLAELVDEQDLEGRLWLGLKILDEVVEQRGFGESRSLGGRPWPPDAAQRDRAGGAAGQLAHQQVEDLVRVARHDASARRPVAEVGMAQQDVGG